MRQPYGLETRRFRAHIGRMDANPKSYVELCTFGQWERVSVEVAVGTTHPVRRVECSQPGKVHKQSSNGMRAHFEHNEANPACSLSYGSRVAK
jgi:hypothetical protein